VRHVGDQVALVIAETYAQAKDAAEQINVTYKELPAIISTADADKSGKPQVWNVSKALLTTCVDLTGDGKCDKRIFLFDDALLNTAWSVDNNGLKNAQFYFFPIPQNIGLTP
jgi:CO/xanthine dehydrogenase Mo-binding subunit